MNRHDFLTSTRSAKPGLSKHTSILLFRGCFSSQAMTMPGQIVGIKAGAEAHSLEAGKTLRILSVNSNSRNCNLFAL